MYPLKPAPKLPAVVLGVVALLWLGGCRLPATLPPMPSPAPTRTAAAPAPASPTAAPAPADRPTSTPLPTPEAGDVCVLYRHEGTLWLKQGGDPAQEIVEAVEEADPSLCPPRTLLPRAEYRDPDTDERLVAHMLLHDCRRHPNGHDVWFNTERPTGYGRHYRSDLWRYDPECENVEQILDDGEGGQFFQFSPDGQYVILATERDIKLMRIDGSSPRQLFEFPEFAVCSEVNAWVVPLWLPDSSGVIVHIPEGCLHAADSWPFGLWWIPIEGDAVAVDAFSEQDRRSILDPSPDPRARDAERYVYWEEGTIYLGQEGREAQPLVALAAPQDGYTAFVCPNAGGS
jgi:hypothetical protein